MKRIDSFRDEYRWLSNFWHAPFQVGPYVWPTVEHYYQAQKSLDLEWQKKIRGTIKPGKTKRLGKTVKLRDDWDDVKLEVMREAVWAKFNQNGDLAKRLVETGNAELAEGNQWGDRFWGEFQGEGENHLGKILMKTRELLKR
jgi:ribA/ribD-fused uncharacterized protein